MSALAADRGYPQGRTLEGLYWALEGDVRKAGSALAAAGRAGLPEAAGAMDSGMLLARAVRQLATDKGTEVAIGSAAPPRPVFAPQTVSSPPLQAR